jgi:malonyl-CoA O-methyltransferase
MSRLLETREAYRLWAPIFDTFASPIVALERRLLSPWLSNLDGKRVLDIGCGTGRWMEQAHSAGSKVFGVDISFDMLERALAKPGLRGRLALADMAYLPIKPDTADVVICTLALGHHREPLGVFSGLLSVTRPDGTLILTDFHPEAIRNGWKRIFKHNGESIEVESYPYSLEEIRAAATEHGFELQQMLEPAFGPDEEQIFIDAGRSDLPPRVRGIPAIAMLAWRRR